MTVLLNEVVGNSGVLLFPMLNDITDANSIDIVRAWLCAMEAIGADALLEEINQLELSAQYAAWTDYRIYRCWCGLLPMSCQMLNNNINYS